MTRTFLKRSAHGPLTSVLAAIALSLPLAACFDDDDDDVVVTPTPTPPTGGTPTPAPTSAFNVSQCIGQTVPGTTITVADLVIPDVLNIDPAQPAGFPNGRTLPDPVIDVTLAVLFLDLNAMGQGPGTFAGLPLNPPANDVPFPTGFPFLAPPQGSPTLEDGGGMAFNFRTEARSAFVRVDRVGMPAVSTALIGSARQNAYNDANPVIDSTGEFVPDIAGRLTALTEGIGDDLLNLGLNICAD